METYGPYLEINLKNLEKNFNTLKSKLLSSTTIIPVIKSNGYGSDGIIIAKKLIALGVKRFAVAYTKEAIELKNAGIKKTIMIFYPNIENIELIVKNKFEPVIYSKGIFEKTEEILKKLRIQNYPVHVKFNTGLNRLGLNLSDCNLILKKNNSIYFNLISVYSHLGASENKKPCKFTEKQIAVFKKIKKTLIKKIKPDLGFHLLNTSGVFNYPEFQFDAVRIGIGLYGNSNSKIWDFELKPVLSLKAPLIQIHNLDKGEYVGYNLGWSSNHKTKIGIIPIGHYDGINRIFGKKEVPVLINNKKTVIIGNICMDMMMVDLTEIKCCEGDIVTIFGEQISSSEIAEIAGTISYELISGISQRVNRKIIE